MLSQRKYLFGTTILAGALAVAAPSFAQTQSTQQPTTTTTTTTTTTQEEGTRVEEVVVTGTRIRRANQFASATPLTIVTTEQTELEGIPDAAAALQQTAVAAGSFQLNDQLTGFVTAGGGGTQSLDLRGLGPQRTLTLLNGRRAGPAGTRGQVQAFDLNVIPQSQVERYDILKDGASSLYGSDAIGGVVNIITRTNQDGGQLNFFASLPMDTGGEQYRVDGSYGQTFDRGYFTVGGEYYEGKILRRQDREDTSCAQDYLTQPVTGQRVDYTDPRTGEYKCYNLTNGYLQAFFPAAAGGTMNLVPISRYGSVYNYSVPGNNVPAPFNTTYARFARNGYPGTILYTPSDSYLWDRSSIISPQKRATINFLGGFDITPGTELYTELMWNRRESSQVGAAQVFQSFAQYNTLYGVANNLPATNPNNPFGVPVVTVSQYESSSFQQIDYGRAVVGLRGSAAWGDRNWDWDVYGQYSRSDAVYDNGPRIYLDRFVALNLPGTACSNTPAPAAPNGGNVSGFNCSALPGGIPWASDRILRGEFTQAERNFLFFQEDGTTTYDHMYAEALLSTERLFSLPAGDVGFAIGAQVRREEIDDTPPPSAAIRNQALFTSAGRTAGSDTIKEFFGELEIPVLRAVPLAESLTINASGRSSNYKSYGTNNTYKVGLNWQITPEWRIRGTVGTSFRAPALYELFLGGQIGYGAQSGVDPCYDYTDTGVSPQVQAACLALGVQPQQVGGSSATISTGGGAGILEAETAENRTIGLIWTPEFADLSVSLDYYDTEINNQVAQYGAYNVILQCLQGNAPFCGLYTRAAPDAGGNRYVAFVNNNYTNINSQVNRGLEFAFQYRREFDFGRLGVVSQHFWELEDRTNALGSVTDTLGTTYNWGGPQYVGNINFTLSRGDWTAFYGVDAIGKGSDFENGGGELFTNARYADISVGGGPIGGTSCTVPSGTYCTRYKVRTEFTTYHSASLRYRVNDWTFQAGVNNLFDERPPAQSPGQFRQGTAALNGYDMRGRRMFFRVGRSF